MADAAVVGFGALGRGSAARAGLSDAPITMIVPFAAGGPTDVIARIVADHMSKTLGQPIVIENVVGAGGTTGATARACGAIDGYTIIMGHMGTHAASVRAVSEPRLSPGEAISSRSGMSAGTPILILAKKDFPPKDLKEFVAYVKANSDQAEHGACRRRLGVVSPPASAELDHGREADRRCRSRAPARR